ncbi:hypothetical protein FKR81_19845 [Lentzea tibetensis]|uniref:Orn/DAP/Arg decarboxylase 2 N-terminal domain-containing protein n=1 Tax=Lentzea tibetensis TaxID=2591470 RepID=A0A563ES65_9PSEU|nr:alanine racemase [Lentzea tibetensis]TWP50432.1 hypothetical protein FKR81_19845 [Lentzea tibetensis]
MTDVSVTAPARGRDFPARVAERLPYLTRDDDGRALLHGRDAGELLTQHGSPVLVLLPDRAADNVRSVKAAFGEHFPDVSVHYAVKACYHAGVVLAAKDAGAGIEVMSGLELQIARQLGFRADQIVLNGLGRDEAYVRGCIDVPEALNVLDTWDDVDAIARAAQQAQVVVDVAVRVTPWMPLELDGATPRDSKLGNHVDGESFWRLLRAVTDNPWLNLRGLHGHQFTRAASLEDYGHYLEGFADVVVEADKRGHRFAVLDIGGGFEARSALEARGVRIDDFAAVAAEKLAVVPSGYRLVVEPGRYVAADAAVGLTKVRARKPRDGFTWQIVDLATNVLIPVPGAEYYPVVLQEDAGDRTTIARIGDGTCAPSTMCDDVELPDVRGGAGLAMLNCGAYTTVFSHVWGPRPPAVVSMDGDGVVEVVAGPAEFTAIAKAMYGYDLDLGAS